MDFHKQIVAARKKQGENFIQARQRETAPAMDVAGSAPADSQRTEQQEIDENAKAIAELAKEYSGYGLDGMY